MIKQWINGKTVIFLIAISIVTGTVFYSQYLSRKIAADEKNRVDTWVQALKTMMIVNDPQSLTLASKISLENKDIPIIETDENDRINPGNCINLDSNAIAGDPKYLSRKLAEFKKQNDPITLVLSDSPYVANKYYYGESILQKEVRYYPIIQLVIVGLFIIITVIAQRTAYMSTQNQLWAGMAKETAHQLGTPVTSLKGWIEVLKDIPGNEKIVTEIEKDVVRLELITDRFGKIGSKPNLEQKNLVEQIETMVEYIKKRSGRNVDFSIDTNGAGVVNAMISPPLFDWVMENLLKNGLDAMEGKGSIQIRIRETDTQIKIDVKDSGKGISKANLKNVFEPGFTTKKRGWGLGLTLAKRIIEQYHKGAIYVKNSEIGKGTTFRIELHK
ncbi:ATP-binding protein [Panacibacter sp. DH6]|uniref:histidine kinase n=1 Tax=Panacibacter microcysteis TaxID=2793269 RepID=A0A931E698_9BACT|nr:ATP-binding protein [Panacibacter microcysteis]MBG9375934.1 ATP-binding protein [Panacibacter microcysteis]